MRPATQQEVEEIGGTPIWDWLSYESTTQLWVLYNGTWTKDLAAIYYCDWTYMLLSIDQGQRISTKKTYPDGCVDTEQWGCLSPGYYLFRFIGDVAGWHKIVAVGSASGQSDEIWIYVWSTSPTPPPPSPLTVTAWPSSSYYNIGDTVRIYYRVNKPCCARATYLKQGSDVVVEGPRYVSAGTHMDTGTIGSPKGRRTVVVDAWTSSGEYAYDVTSYTVVY
jgi:hypothetical protein